MAEVFFLIYVTCLHRMRVVNDDKLRACSDMQTNLKFLKTDFYELLLLFYKPY